jgi:type IV pilus assembly protein PilA
MLHKLSRRAKDEKGFTLIELLVVILIIGILAAIAIPAFLNQRNKAYDSAAKSQIKTAQTAEETYATDQNGSYASDVVGTPGATGVLNGSLATIEPALKNSPTVTATGTAAGYTLVSTAAGSGSTPDVFTLTVSNGTQTRTCTGAGGGCVGGTW